MSIPHRVFVSKHKRKKFITKVKPAYKKFLGLPSHKAVIQTKYSLRPKQLKSRLIASSAITRKYLTHPYYISALVWKQLSAAQKGFEAIAARGDSKRFVAAAEGAVESSVATFQAFIPKQIWDKMSFVERSAHIKKRKELNLHRKSNVKARSKYSFALRAKRPVLTKLSFLKRRSYLKSLIRPKHALKMLGQSPFNYTTESCFIKSKLQRDL